MKFMNPLGLRSTCSAVLCLGMNCALPALLFTSQAARAAECRFSIEQSSPKLTWTGYKFTEKTPVSGSFDSIEFKQTAAKKVSEAIKSIQFSVDTASINSDNPLRDKKLALYIFGALVNPGEITGKVTSIDLKTGKATAEITMNGVKKVLPFTITVDKNIYTFESKLDLLDFKMKRAVDAIHAACEKLHIGKDGKSVTWSEVSLKVTASLEEKCSE